MSTSNEENLKEKTFKGFFWRSGERIVSQLISFVVTIVLARLLMPEEFGVIALTQIFIILADVFVTNGLGVSLIQKNKTDSLDYSTMLSAGLVLSLIIYTVLFFLSPFIAKTCGNNLLSPVIRVMALRLPIAALNSVQQSILSIRMEFRKFFFATLSGTILSGVIGICMAESGYGVWSLVSQYLSNSIFNTIVLLFLVDWVPSLRFSKQRFLSMFSFGWKMTFSNFVGVFFDQIKNFIIGAKYSAADLAYFNRGEQIPNLLSTNINGTIDAVLFPALSKIQDNKESVRNGVRRSMRISSFVLIPLLFCLAAASENIIRVLLTDKWIECVPYMQIICIQCGIGVLSAANLQALKAIGRSDVLLKLECIKKSILLAVILIMMHISVIAMALGYACYALLALIINAFPNKSLIGYGFVSQMKDVLPNLLLGSTTAFLVFLVGYISNNIYWGLSLQIITGGVSIIVLSYLFKMESMIYIVNLLHNLKKHGERY